MNESVTAIEEAANGLVEADQEAWQAAEIVEDQLMMSPPPPGMSRMEYVMEYIPAATRETYLSARELQDALLGHDRDSAARALVLQARQVRVAALELFLMPER
ncbi:MAG: hypothetical protein OXI33_10545 [Chloroflexota bacterium]|nr:hypothetical protein [Chloroflexota bacterium]